MKLVLHPPVREELLVQIRNVANVQACNADDHKAAVAAIADADAFYGRLTPEMLAGARKLRWVQAPVAGVEKYVFPELRDSPVTLTNMRGIFSDHIADHAFAYVLCFARGFHKYFRKQLEGRWDPKEPVLHLGDCTLGIIGFGGIGQALATRAIAHDMQVVAVDAVPRVAGGVEAWGLDRLNELLARADFVVSCVPHTPHTEKLIGRDQFARMKPTAYFINISRGIVVDLTALTDALSGGVIAGAGLDVYEIEPLPGDHPLWKMDNVILTPHTAGHSPRYEERREKVLLDNLQRFVDGRSLVNVVDKAQWYVLIAD